MTDGFHAADDGSLTRSTGGAAARGAMLIALAIVIGLVLLLFALDDQDTEVAAVEDDTEEVADDGTEAPVDEGDADPPVEAVDPTNDPAETDGAGTIDATESIPEEPIAGSGVARPASEVNVLVANGIGTPGIAGSAADVLVADGYIGVAADAPNTGSSSILYKPGFDADALAVAAILGAAPDVVGPAAADGSIPVNQNALDDGRADSANVVVIIGSDGAIPTS